MTDNKDFNRNSESRDTPHSSSRRRILTVLAAGTGAAVLLPEKWVKPVVDKVMTPAHAQATAACSAPEGCYNAAISDFLPAPGGISFNWPGGSGLEFVVVTSGPNCSTEAQNIAPQVPIVVASSEAEAVSLLGTVGSTLLYSAPVTVPALPPGCGFYVGRQVFT